jgi:hypothetical protein
MYVHLIYFLNTGVMYVVTNFITSVYIFELSVGVQTYKNIKNLIKTMYEFFKLLAHIQLLSETFNRQHIA